jgi:hypothetical protein
VTALAVTARNAEGSGDNESSFSKDLVHADKNRRQAQSHKMVFIERDLSDE